MENKNTEILEIGGHKYLVLSNCQNTLASMVMLGEVKVYWLDRDFLQGEDKVDEVTNPQTIWGACPNRFGIRID